MTPFSAERFGRAFAQFFKFGLVGVSNTAVSYLIYAVSVYLGLHYLAANVIAFALAVLNSFVLNQKFVFKREFDSRRDLGRALLRTYASYAFSGFAVSSALLYVFIEIVGISKYIAPFCGLIVTVPLNYILMKLWAFKSDREARLGERNEEGQRTDTVL